MPSYMKEVDILSYYGSIIGAEVAIFGIWMSSLSLSYFYVKPPSTIEWELDWSIFRDFSRIG